MEQAGRRSGSTHPSGALACAVLALPPAPSLHPAPAALLSPFLEARPLHVTNPGGWPLAAGKLVYAKLVLGSQSQTSYVRKERTDGSVEW